MANGFLAKNLGFLLKKNALSSAKLSDSCGVDKPIISRILSGKTTNPQVATLKPIADFFGITIDQLIGSSDIHLEKNHGVIVPINRLLVPIIEWKHVPYWLDIKNNYQSTQTIDAKSTISPDSFALLIENDQFEPRFARHSVIIVDPTLTPKNRDFIVTKEANGSIIIDQIIIENNKTFLKGVGGKFEMKKIKNLLSFGVITESHLNLTA